VIEAPYSTGPYADGKTPLTVYVPPGYEQTGDACAKRYPTLYLLHGSQENEVQWSTAGYAGVIEDNLLAAGLAEPMVIVMPTFNNVSRESDPATGAPDVVFPMNGFRENVMKAYLPWAESHLCVRKGQAARAFAGLSQGADDTISLLQNEPDAFAYFGVQSPVCVDVTCPATNLLTASGAKTIKCVQFGSGLADSLGSEKDVALLQADLIAAGVPYRRHMTPADDTVPATALLVDHQLGLQWQRETGHTWDSWRQQLRDELMHVFFQPHPACSG
jgi:enterochelin esterase-like enzyme